MKYPITTAVALLLMGTAAQGGSCEKAWADHNQYVAQYEATPKSEFWPGARETNEKQIAREKARLLEGCAPGGFYDQLDEAIRQVRAKCAAQPDTKGC
jgi:hypothetical protein